jgi:UDP-glucose 4-epimerase
MGKKVAITGVTSYFALTLMPKLQADPVVEEIIGIGRRPWTGGFDKLTYYREDIRSKKLFDLFKGVDAVYHLAFVVGEIHDKQKTLDININGSKNVFEACAANNVKKVIYTSSMTAYGSHSDNILGLKECDALTRNEDNYYNSCKIDVENYVTNFFQDYPDITLTVLRAGLLVGPNINNMFSDLWSMKVSALPVGRTSHNQMISEEDLGEAMYLPLVKELPGVFNVAGDDAVPTRWCFKATGAFVIPLPIFLLKLIANVAFKLHLFPASEGWVSLSEYTIFCNTDKFKNAAGWQPKHSSKEAFMQFVEARKRNAKDTPKQAFFTYLYSTPWLTKLSLQGLNALFYVIGKTPILRDIIPITSPKKNNMTYLPTNKNIENKTSNVFEINKSVGETVNEILPQQVLNDMIETYSFHFLMDKCICRTGYKCKNFTHEVGCMFMGETAKKLPPGLGRKVTKDQAQAHVKKAVGLGLIPMTGKVNVDNLGFLTPDTKELFSVCFCCHCCCMMGYYKHSPEHQKKIFKPVEGLHVRVNQNCIGCGTCIEACIFDNITIQKEAAHHLGHCVGCGRCQTTCPNNAVDISVNNPNYVNDVKNRLKSFVKIS